MLTNVSEQNYYAPNGIVLLVQSCAEVDDLRELPEPGS